MKERLNCPNCAAPITNGVCEYCGTQFYDFANIDIGKPCYLRIKFNNQIVTVKAITKNCAVERGYVECSHYVDNRPYYLSTIPNAEMSLDFVLLPNEKGELFESRVIK